MNVVLKTFQCGLVPLCLIAALPIWSSCGPAAGADNERVDFSRASSFDVIAREGEVHLLFGIDRDSPSFHYSRSADGGTTWRDPVELPTHHAPPGRHHRGNDPQLAVAGQQVFAVWTAAGEGPWGSGPLAMAHSDDGGRSWHPSPAPRATTEEVGFRFPAIAADDRGLHAIWIHAEGDERSLRHARRDIGAEEWSVPKVIDPHICACCWNRLEVAGDGTLVALYRDHAPSDMALAVSEDRGQTWEKRGHVGRFDWDFQGCPHVGGGLALGTNGDLFATVWSGHEEHTGAYLMRSDNLGKSWLPEPPAGETFRPGRHTDVAVPDAERVIMTWDQPADRGKRAVLCVVSDDGGRTWNAPRPLSEPGEHATHPRLAAWEDGALVLWSGRDATGEPMTHRKRLELPARD